MIGLEKCPGKMLLQSYFIVIYVDYYDMERRDLLRKLGLATTLGLVGCAGRATFPPAQNQASEPGVSTTGQRPVDELGAPQGQPTAGIKQVAGEFVGPAEVHTGRVQYNGNQISGYTSKGVYSVSAYVILDPPYVTRVNAENNPVNLMTGSEVDSAMGATRGDFFLRSAAMASTPDHPEPSVIQAWRLRVQGNKVRGEFVTNRTAVSNFVMEVGEGYQVPGVDMSAPFDVPYGTRFQATVTGDLMNAQILPPAIGRKLPPEDQMAYAAQIRMELKRT